MRPEGELGYCSKSLSWFRIQRVHVYIPETVYSLLPERPVFSFAPNQTLTKNESETIVSGLLRPPLLPGGRQGIFQNLS